MKSLLQNKRLAMIVTITGVAILLLASHFGWISDYLEMIVIYIGINIILTASLNLVNGYMGEFSCGHAGFMAIGAYMASLFTVQIFPEGNSLWRFPLAILAGGSAAALAGLLVAFPSFRTRGDYLAIVTLAFGMIVKSVIENIPAIGGPRGYLGMEQLTNLPWVIFWVAVTLWSIRNLVYSRFGRGVSALRDDEIASELVGVNTRHVKLLVFIVSSFFAGVAGGLFAHELMVISPKSFDILKSTEILVMVYLGGIGSITGSVIGATVYTVLLECLRPLGAWRMVVMPLLLVLLMIFRPRGIMGLREIPWLVPQIRRTGKCSERRSADEPA